MDVKCTESNSALFVVDKIYRVRQVFGVYCDETDLVVIDEDGDPWKFTCNYDGGDITGVRLFAKFELY
ncbi:hypothetical protein [Escherichia coli]|uniref:hypothetical protein n=1 Tax=Escherichia coli TaxID=562 RepID=UPI001ED53160|nr:hypothetical protein [Escherichia coli]MBZ9352491.1 hypothetical protein [Escherichia coli]MEB7178688.1 hypothetical protein [Escherichia coli]